MCGLQSEKKEKSDSALQSSQPQSQANREAKISHAQMIKEPSCFRVVEGVIQRQKIVMKNGDPFYKKIKVNQSQDESGSAEGKSKLVKRWYHGVGPINVEVEDVSEEFTLPSGKGQEKKRKMKKIKENPEKSSEGELSENPKKDDYISEEDICLSDNGLDNGMYRKEMIYKGMYIYEREKQDGELKRKKVNENRKVFLNPNIINIPYKIKEYDRTKKKNISKEISIPTLKIVGITQKNEINELEEFVEINELKKIERKEGKEWFNNAINRMEHFLSEKNQQGDIEEIVLKNQFQGPINGLFGDTIRKKESSPLDVTAYARGTETKLWQLLNSLQRKQIREFIKETDSLDESNTKMLLDNLKSYKLYSVTEKIEIFTKPLKLFNSIQEFINTFKTGSEEAYYISDENILLVSETELGKKLGGSEFTIEQTLNHNLNFKGLRVNISESAEKEAALMKKYMEKRGYSEKAVRKILNRIMQYGGEYVPLIGISDLGTESETKQINKVEEDLKKVFDKDFFKSNEFYQENINIVLGLLKQIDDIVVSKPVRLEFDRIIENLTKIDKKVLSNDKDAQIKYNLKCMDDFYFCMQKLHQLIRECFNLKIDDEKAEEEFSSALCSLAGAESGEEVRSPQLVLAEAHGLAMYRKISDALKEKKTYVDEENIYFETPELFPNRIQGEEEEIDVYVMEPHPNNAAKDSVEHKDPLSYVLEKLNNITDKQITIIMDVTLNCLADEEIQELLKNEEVEKFIKDGKLNLVLLQSGTKFYTHGMDIASVGTALVYNNKDNWKSFNEDLINSSKCKFQTEEEDSEEKPQYAINITKKDQKYFAKMLTLKNSEKDSKYYQQVYLDKIKNNAHKLYNQLVCMNTQTEDALKVLESTTGTENAKNVYVAIRFKDEFVKKILTCTGEEKEKYKEIFKNFKNDVGSLSDGEYNPTDYKYLEKFNKGVLFSEIKKLFKEYYVYDRQSFGFDITNIGECGTTIRITTGIESESYMETYADIIKDLSKKLMAGNTK